jgi:predicted phage-related endonuclease
MIIHDVQQGSYEWHQLRLGKITSTRLKKLMSKDNLSLVDELIAEEETGISDDDGFVSEEMQRGIDLEPLAIKEYESVTGNTVTRYGFLQSDELPILCQSPDGYVGVDGAIEVKCPKTKTHIKYIRQGKIPNDYKEQVWTYFMVNPNLKWLDFISYDPRLTKKPIWILRVNREDVQDDIIGAWMMLQAFNEKYIRLKEELFF